MKKILSVCVAMMLMLTLVACGGKKDDTIIGKWESVESIEGITMTYDFQKDDKMVITMSGISVDGTYKLDGDKITMEMSVAGQKQELGTGTYKIDGDKLTITLENESQDFKRVK